MKYLLTLLIANALIAQEAPKAAAVSAASNGNKSMIVIEPKARAADYVVAFDQLRKDKPTLKIIARTANGSILNISDLTAAPGGTLLFLRILSNQGTRIQVVPVEEMMEITYSP